MHPHPLSVPHTTPRTFRATPPPSPALCSPPCWDFRIFLSSNRSLCFFSNVPSAITLTRWISSPPPALPPPIPLNSPPLDNIVWVTSALIFGIIFHADHLWDLITRGLVLTKVAPLVYSVYGFSVRQIRVFTNQQTHLPVRFQLGRDIALEVAGTPVTLDKKRFQIMAGRMTSLLQLYNSLNLKGLSPVHKEFQFWHFWFLVR